MGPLAGLKVIEFQGIGPGPFAGMLLADMGADVLLVDRPRDDGPGTKRPRKYESMLRGRRSLVLDLKSEHGVNNALALIEKADVLIEGFRPGVMERLGLGPDAALTRNPRLVYGRVTGWGREGPLAMRAGHDINYIVVAGALGAIGRADQPPTPPLALVGDLGGGGMVLAFGLVCALLEARNSGQGQVVDAAMIDGVSLLTTAFHGMLDAGMWNEERGSNLLDSGAPWYDSYATQDGQYVCIGPIEPPFYKELIARLGLAEGNLPGQHDRARWPELRERFAAVFRTQTLDQWNAIFEGSDACFAPVLSLSQVRQHPHNLARNAFVELGGVCHPAPAPRLSRTPARLALPPPERGSGGWHALKDWGFLPEEIHRFETSDNERGAP